MYFRNIPNNMSYSDLLDTKMIENQYVEIMNNSTKDFLKIPFPDLFKMQEIAHKTIDIGLSHINLFERPEQALYAYMNRCNLYKLMREMQNPSFSDFKTKIPLKTNLKTSKKANLHATYGALYNAGELQEKKSHEGVNSSTDAFPITVQIFPLETKKLVESLLKELYGENIIKSSGEDLEFISAVDDLGRSEVLVFADTNELYIPTNQEYFMYSNTKKHFTQKLEESKILVFKKNPVEIMRDRDYSTGFFEFFDMGYSVRVIASAIQSIKQNEIISLNEVIPMHSVSSVIKDYPILTHIAKHPEDLKEHIKELSVIAKVLQIEYDQRNYQNLRFNIDELKFRKDYNGPENFDLEMLTEEKKGILQKLKNVEEEVHIPEVVDYEEKVFEETKKDTPNAIADKMRYIISKNNPEEKSIKEIYDSIESTVLYSSYDINTWIKEGYLVADCDEQNLKHVQFLDYLAHMDFKNLNANEIISKNFESMDLSQYDSETISCIKAIIISKVAEYHKNIKAAKDESDYQGSLEYLSDLSIINAITNSPQIIERKHHFDISQYDIPIEYLDISDLYQTIDNLYAAGLSESVIKEKIHANYKDNPKTFAKLPEKDYEPNEIFKIMIDINQGKHTEDRIKDLDKIAGTTGFYEYYQTLSEKEKNEMLISLVSTTYMKGKTKKIQEEKPKVFEDISREEIFEDISHEEQYKDTTPNQEVSSIPLIEGQIDIFDIQESEEDVMKM